MAEGENWWSKTNWSQEPSASSSQTGSWSWNTWQTSSSWKPEYQAPAHGSTEVATAETLTQTSSDASKANGVIHVAQGEIPVPWGTWPQSSSWKHANGDSQGEALDAQKGNWTSWSSWQNGFSWSQNGDAKNGPIQANTTNLAPTQEPCISEKWNTSSHAGNGSSAQSADAISSADIHTGSYTWGSGNTWGGWGGSSYGQWGYVSQSSSSAQVESNQVANGHCISFAEKQSIADGDALKLKADSAGSQGNVHENAIYQAASGSALPPVNLTSSTSNTGEPDRSGLREDSEDGSIAKMSDRPTFMQNSKQEGQELHPWVKADPWRKAAEQAHNGVLPGASLTQARDSTLQETKIVEQNSNQPYTSDGSPSKSTPSTSAMELNTGAKKLEDEKKRDLWSSFKAGSHRSESSPPFNRTDLSGGSLQRHAVMKDEVIDALMASGGPDATYVDCTFGRGGHSQEILRRLSSQGRLVAFDLDPAAYRVGQALERQDSRFKIHHRPHGDLADVVEQGTNLGGILLDLGTSTVGSEERRGFSAVDDGPLDFRLNPNLGIPAWQWLQTVSVAELAWVIHTYGEDNDPVLSQRLAEAILERQRRAGAYTSTLELADVCRETKQGLDDRGMHPAKLTFQAIRAFLNHESDQLRRALLGGMTRLNSQGRAVVITYKRREATQVKQFLREHEEPDPRFVTMVSPSRLNELYPLCTTDLPFKCIQAQEPMKPTPEECNLNKNSKTAMFHVLLKESREASSSPSKGATPRAQSEQWKKPSPLPFMGSTAPISAGLRDSKDFVDARSIISKEASAESDPQQTATLTIESDHQQPPDFNPEKTADTLRSGDWVCPACGDMQWAKRPRCRRCGAAPLTS
eukprot:gnl/MRDRNA2_/MRDRNA2_36293_c0_seq1.p1 gnl/MRDRNA2_/MRDRNA2_36293_c0~~gnl/MRDRNA2_/MRDRNA2_36293_c0_seq1.p1  ORF type:complete len:885 (+),score=160.39 gnl/MRDRNA2_/MRDRNA2_36293_c0_seq1:75-2657(+)